MLNLTSCCARMYYNEYYTMIWKYLKEYLDDVLRKELFGDTSVVCDYKKINNLVYLKEKLDHMKTQLDNRLVGISMGLEVPTEEELVDEYCLESTSKYFRTLGVNIEPLLDLYKEGIYDPVTEDLKLIM